jgi:ubiquinone/menaquinone biosynthesis C-methylase UbiE
MDHDKEKQHQARIVDQFSRQAIPFSKVPGHYDAMQILVEMAQVRSNDNVLDVACGPGLVACEFAPLVKHVTGVDITSAMIEQAMKLQAERKLVNITWDVGEAVPLPYPDEAFSLVITRYSFHHLLSPEKALAEMIRVCQPGGRVLVADVAIEPSKSEAYDQLEIMRDPSHTHALTEVEFNDLFDSSGLTNCHQSRYGVDIELEAQLEASFPKSGDKPRLRKMITDDIGQDKFGINARMENDNVVYTVPIAVFVGQKT